MYIWKQFHGHAVLSVFFSHFIMQITTAFLALAALATSAVAAPANRWHRGDSGRFLGGNRPYAINEHISFVSHRFGTQTYGFRSGTVGWVDEIAPVFDEVCEVLIPNSPKTFPDRSYWRAVSKELPHGQGGRLKVELEFQEGQTVTKEECVAALEELALFYGVGGNERKWTYGGWSYSHEGNAKTTMSFVAV